MWFLCFLGINSFIFGDMNSEWSWELLIVLFCCEWIRMGFFGRTKEYRSYPAAMTDFSPAISCLLIGIIRRSNGWYPTIFEVEGEYHLQGSRKTDFWWTVMHVNIFRVIWGVEIWWDQHMLVHIIKKVFLKWYMIASCQRSRKFLHDQLWFYQASFQLLFLVLTFLLQYFCLLYCWNLCSKVFHKRMRQKKISYLHSNLVLMKIWHNMFW